jgi:hypothetical protein
VLAVGPAAATTEVEDVDGGPSCGCWWQVRQRPPPKLKTSMAGPLGVLEAGPAAATTEVEDVDLDQGRIDLCQVKQEKYMNKKKLNINLVHHLWLDLDQGRIDQVIFLSIGYLWKQLDHKKKVFKNEYMEDMK